MKLEIGGNEAIPGSADALWAALNDPKVLTRCIAGCKSMVEIGPDTYKLDMQLRVAAVGGSFEGEISLSDKEVPRACSIRSRGPARWVTATARRVLRSNRTAKTGAS